MLKNMNYIQKFRLLNPWFGLIIESVKKDLKQEHLAKDPQFVKLHFKNKPLQKITSEDLKEVYERLLSLEEEKIAEFIAVRWLLKHSDLYHYFESHLAKIDPDFDKLEILQDQHAKELINGALSQFGPSQTYLFSIFNSVVFPEKELHNLRENALQELSIKQKVEVEAIEAKTLHDLKAKYELEIQRMQDKYEKKILGLQKKYIQDTESLKKQIAGLQKKVYG